MASTSVNIMTLMDTVVLGAYCVYYPQMIINMNLRTKLYSDLGKRGAARNVLSCSLAQWTSCDSEGKRAPSSSDLWKIATWNVRSLYQKGKLANVCKNMHMLKIDILGISKAFWKGNGKFMCELPNGKKFEVMYSGTVKHRKGVAFIIGKRIINSVLSYQAVSERHMTLKVSGRARNVLVHQIYAPNMDDDVEEVENYIEVLS